MVVGSGSALSEDMIVCEVAVVIIDIVIDYGDGLGPSALRGILIEIVVT